MSSAGAGIGYALATVEDELSAAKTLVFIAVVALWAMSFLAGFKNLSYLNLTMVLSKSVIEEREKPSHQTSELQKAITNAVTDTSEKIGRGFKFFESLQMLALVAGALTFVFLKVDVCTAIAFVLSKFY
jgi:type III secretory pathway component EscV